MTAPLEEIRAILAGYYDEIDRAFQNKDVEAVGRFIAPTFSVSLDNGGTMTRDDLLDSIRHQLSELTVRSWHRAISHLELEGDTVKATAQGVFMARTNTGEDIAWLLTSEDVWIENDGTWLVTSSRTVEAA